MKADKNLLSGSTTLLVLSLLAAGDKYGYEMIAELDARSDHTFTLKEGTLYPHSPRPGEGRGSEFLHPGGLHRPDPEVLPHHPEGSPASGGAEAGVDSVFPEGERHSLCPLTGGGGGPVRPRLFVKGGPHARFQPL